MSAVLRPPAPTCAPAPDAELPQALHPLTAEELATTPLDALADVAVPGEPLVVAFGFAQWARPAAFDGFGRLKKLEALRGRPFGRIFVRDPANDWYLGGVPGLGSDVPAVAAALQRAIERLKPSSVITFGQSMGGYAAVLFGRLIGAERVVAFSPLSTLDPAAARQAGDHRWLGVLESLQGRGLLGPTTDLAPSAGSAGPTLRLHYGSTKTPDDADRHDVWHAERFAASPTAQVTLHPGAGHLVAQHLKAAGGLDALLLHELFDIDPALVVRPPPRVLDDGWLQWIAENRLRGCDEAGLLHGMQAAGLDGVTARSALLTVARDPCFRAGRRLARRLRKLESVLDNQQRLHETAAFADRIERRSLVGREEFVERYVRGSRPVLLTGVTADWPARERWSLAGLEGRFGAVEVEVQAGRNADAAYEIRKLAHRRRMPLAAFIALVKAGCGNDAYLTANNEVLRQPELRPLLDDIGPLPAFCRRDLLEGASSLWVGGAGTVTPLHHDTLMLLHLHLEGCKRWRFVSPLQTPLLYNETGVFSEVDLDAPDPARHPLFAEARVLEVVAGPGDAVFIPLGWWHQVRALTPCVSLSLAGFTFPNEYGCFDAGGLESAQDAFGP